jgi:hypothetical protein
MCIQNALLSGNFTGTEAKMRETGAAVAQRDQGKRRGQTWTAVIVLSLLLLPLYCLDVRAQEEQISLRRWWLHQPNLRGLYLHACITSQKQLKFSQQSEIHFPYDWSPQCRSEAGEKTDKDKKVREREDIKVSGILRFRCKPKLPELQNLRIDPCYQQWHKP